jgi:hypothetical protein
MGFGILQGFLFFYELFFQQERMSDKIADKFVLYDEVTLKKMSGNTNFSIYLFAHIDIF